MQVSIGENTLSSKTLFNLQPFIDRFYKRLLSLTAADYEVFI